MPRKRSIDPGIRHTISDKQKEKVYLSQQGKCSDCIIFLPSKWQIHQGRKIRPFKIFGGDVHHIIPLSKGGKHSPENWILLCCDCHPKRHIEIIKMEKGKEKDVR